MGRLTLLEQLKADGRSHMLILEFVKTRTNPRPNPQDYVGQFILTYELDLQGGMGTPIMADDLNDRFQDFISGMGEMGEYNRKVVFRMFKYWGIDAQRVTHSGKDTKIYFVNPLHKLSEDDHES